MRVIAGSYRGLRLKTLKSTALRPTSDQMRETLFDVLGERIVGATFLDAYAGSGAVGIEALSRGSARVVFVERHKAAADLIRENLGYLGISSGFEILTAEVEKAIVRLDQEGAEFQFAFLDPPYAEIREYHRILRVLARSRILLPTARVIAEHSRLTRLESDYGALHFIRTIRHGDSQLSFYHQIAANGQ
jgi:16S rRNA (guanine966-N2)-methyltransferase